jgi:hypothetical protein
MSERAVLFLAVLVFLIPFAEDGLEVRRDHWFSW